MVMGFGYSSIGAAYNRQAAEESGLEGLQRTYTAPRKDPLAADLYTRQAIQNGTDPRSERYKFLKTQTTGPLGQDALDFIREYEAEMAQNQPIQQQSYNNQLDSISAINPQAMAAGYSAPQQQVVSQSYNNQYDALAAMNSPVLAAGNYNDTIDAQIQQRMTAPGRFTGDPLQQSVLSQVSAVRPAPGSGLADLRSSVQQSAPWQAVQSGIDVIRPPLLDAAGTLGGIGLNNSPLGGPIALADRFLGGPSSGEISRGVADIALPRDPLELGLELVPGIGSVPDAARLTGRGTRALGRAGGEALAQLGESGIGRGIAEGLAQGESGAFRLPGSGSELAGRFRSRYEEEAQKIREAYAGLTQAQKVSPTGRIKDIVSEYRALTTTGHMRINRLGLSIDEARSLANEGVVSAAPNRQRVLDSVKPKASSIRSRGEFGGVRVPGGGFSGDVGGQADNIPPSGIRSAENAVPDDVEALLREMNPGETKAPFVPYTPEQLASQRVSAPVTTPRVRSGGGSVPPQQPPTTSAGGQVPPGGPPEGPTALAAQPQNLGDAGKSFIRGLVKSPVEEVGNTMRQLAAGLDMSYALRQGVLSIRHGRQGLHSVASGARAATDESYAIARDATLRAKDRHGLFLSDLPGTKGGKLTTREENYASDLASSLPGYKQIGRGNTMLLNEQRAGIYDLVEEAWQRTEGVTGWLNSKLARDNDLDALAKYIDRTTGRGTLGPLEDTGWSSLLGLGFFSPRYLASRPQAFLNLLNVKNPLVAIEAWKDFGFFTAATASLLGLAEQSGLADVNLDPTSADFGKFRAGDIRVDPWAGFQQIVRFGAKVGSAGWDGDMDEVVNQLERFLRTKAAPLPGTVYDLTRGKGENIIGEKVTPRSLAISIAPIFVQGMIKAAVEGNDDELVKEALMAPLGFAGLGVQVYGESRSQQLSNAITELGFTDPTSGKPITEWSQLTSAQKLEARQNPDVEAIYADTEGRDPKIVEAETKRKEAFDKAWATYQSTGDIDRYNKTIDQIQVSQEFGDYETKGDFNKKMDAFWQSLEETYDPIDRGKAFEEFETSLSAAEKAEWDKVMASSTDPHYKTLKEANQWLSETYYARQDELFNQAKQQFPVLAEYDDYRAALNSGDKAAEQTAYKVVGPQITQWKVTHPAEDALLYILGRSDTLYSPEAVKIYQDWVKQNGIKEKVPQTPSGQPWYKLEK